VSFIEMAVVGRRIKQKPLRPRHLTEQVLKGVKVKLLKRRTEVRERRKWDDKGR
jgi:hypothetical protein